MAAIYETSPLWDIPEIRMYLLMSASVALVHELIAF